MLSEQLYLFFFIIVFIHVIPRSWSISKCCPNSIRIPSWLRNSHCGERRSHQRLISAVGLFPAIWRLSLYWISTRLHLFNTNTERWHQLQNKLLWNDLLKAKPKRQPSLGSMPIFLIAWAPGAVIPQSSPCQTRRTVGSVIDHVIASWKPLRPSPSQVYQMICR